MPTTYEPAPDAVAAQAALLVGEYYPELKEAELTLLIQMAHAPRNQFGEPKGAAVWDHGLPSPVMTKVVPLKDRVAGLADVRIVLDGDQWDKWPTAKQAAVLDHGICRIELVVDDDGHLQSDNIGRPRCRLRRADWCAAGFSVLMDRHREHAVETESAYGLVRELQKVGLPVG